ncbi:hypothetical protein HOY80DRAFT_954627 [Tuber brumale]|nr:hypothetical protein HOY80DRAFT_954627 [Tuber brumale]
MGDRWRVRVLVLALWRGETAVWMFLGLSSLAATLVLEYSTREGPERGGRKRRIPRNPPLPRHRAWCDDRLGMEFFNNSNT